MSIFIPYEEIWRYKVTKRKWLWKNKNTTAILNLKTQKWSKKTNQMTTSWKNHMH